MPKTRTASPTPPLSPPPRVPLRSLLVLAFSAIGLCSTTAGSDLPFVADGGGGGGWGGAGVRSGPSDCNNPRNALVLYTTGRRLDNHYWFNKNKAVVLDMGLRPLICRGEVDSMVIYDNSGQIKRESRERRLEQTEPIVFNLERWSNKLLEFNKILLAVIPNTAFVEGVLDLHVRHAERRLKGDFEAVFYTNFNRGNLFLRQIGAVSGNMGSMTHPAYYLITQRPSLEVEKVTLKNLV